VYFGYSTSGADNDDDKNNNGSGRHPKIQIALRIRKMTSPHDGNIKDAGSKQHPKIASLSASAR
jgi:hypothetical protein